MEPILGSKKQKIDVWAGFHDPLLNLKIKLSFQSYKSIDRLLSVSFLLDVCPEFAKRQSPCSYESKALADPNKTIKPQNPRCSWLGKDFSIGGLRVSQHHNSADFLCSLQHHITCSNRAPRTDSIKTERASKRSDLRPLSKS